jgi:hypothetical protein
VRGLPASLRWWLPICVAMLCLALTQVAGTTLTWFLLLAGFALLFDGVTAMWASAGRTGGMSSYRQ